MIKIEFHPEAERELSEAKSWYRERSKLAARAFATDIADSIRESRRRRPVGLRFDPEKDVLFSRGSHFQFCTVSGQT